MSVKVFTDSELLAAVEANADNVLQIVRKKEPKKINGTEFCDARWNIAGLTNKEGWFNVSNIELSDGVADPNNKLDKRNEFNKPDGTSKMRLVLQTTLGKSGNFGKALHVLNGSFCKRVQELVDGNKAFAGRKLHELFQYKLSLENKNNPGGDIEDPVLRFQMDFNNFPAKYPHKFLQNTPKTVIYDARTETTAADGTVQYKEAEVEVNGVMTKVNADNVHLFVTRGSKIIKMRCMMPSVPVSQNWISLPITANRVVILPGESSGFSDEVEFEKPAQPANRPETPPVGPNADESAEPSQPVVNIDQDAVNEMLKDLAME
jgi:hypothetical protein